MFYTLNIRRNSLINLRSDAYILCPVRIMYTYHIPKFEKINKRKNITYIHTQNECEVMTRKSV